MANFKVDTTQLANVGFFPGREQLGGRYFVSLGRGEWLVSPKGPIKAKGAKRGEMDAAEGSWPANYYPDNALFLYHYGTAVISENAEKDAFASAGASCLGPEISINYPVTGQAGTGWTNTTNIAADDSAYAYCTPPSMSTYTFFADWDASGTLASHPEYTIKSSSFTADLYITTSVTYNYFRFYQVYDDTRRGTYVQVKPTASGTYQRLTGTFNLAPLYSQIASSNQEIECIAGTTSSTSYSCRIEYLYVTVTFFEAGGTFCIGESADDVTFDGAFYPKLYLKERLTSVHDHHLRIQGV